MKAPAVFEFSLLGVEASGNKLKKMLKPLKNALTSMKASHANLQMSMKNLLVKKTGDTLSQSTNTLGQSSADSNDRLVSLASTRIKVDTDSRAFNKIDMLVHLEDHTQDKVVANLSIDISIIPAVYYSIKI